MATKLYHATPAEAADAIMQDGFRDSVGSYMLEGMELTGVFVSDVPLDENEGTKGGATIEIVCAVEPDPDLELVEDKKPYREWCLPASWLNAQGTLRLLDDDERGWTSSRPS